MNRSPKSRFYQCLLLLSCALLFDTPVWGKGSEIKFDSIVNSVTVTDIDAGTVDILVKDFTVSLIVNGDTEIISDGAEVTLDDLEVGDSVSVEAFFSTAGITAEEIVVLENRFQNFRLRGEISNVAYGVPSPADSSSTVTRITLLGVDVYVDDEVKITQRGSNLGNHVEGASLAPGYDISVHGKFSDVLWADRIHVGTRMARQVEVDGEISEILEDGSYLVALKNGGTVTLLLNEESEVSGDLATGAFVEIEGMFDESLRIVATEVVVDEDGDGDGDDDHRRGNAMFRGHSQGHFSLKANEGQVLHLPRLPGL